MTLIYLEKEVIINFLFIIFSQEKNGVLTSSMRELSNTIGQLQAREQELVTKLKLKVCYL